MFMCELLGIEHGVDLPRLIEVGDYISTELKRENLSAVRMEDLDKIESLRKKLFA